MLFAGCYGLCLLSRLVANFDFVFIVWGASMDSVFAVCLLVWVCLSVLMCVGLVVGVTLFGV